MTLSRILSPGRHGRLAVWRSPAWRSDTRARRSHAHFEICRYRAVSAESPYRTARLPLLVSGPAPCVWGVALFHQYRAAPVGHTSNLSTNGARGARPGSWEHDGPQSGGLRWSTLIASTVTGDHTAPTREHSAGQGTWRHAVGFPATCSRRLVFATAGIAIAFMQRRPAYLG
jgi:hypothetical protein